MANKWRPAFEPRRAVYAHESGAQLRWNSRSHRKGRFPSLAGTGAGQGQGQGQGLECKRPRFKLGLTSWEPGNISWLVAHAFLWGSVSWCVNGCLLFIPPHPNTGQKQAAAWTAWTGGTLFEAGAVLAVLEALNTGHPRDFGPALQRAVEGGGGQQRPASGDAGQTDGHAATHGQGQGQGQTAYQLWNVPGGSRAGSKRPADNQGQNQSQIQGHGEGNGDTHGTDGAQGQGQDASHGKFRWRPAKSDWRSLGYLASIAQLLGATIFWISVFAGLPHVTGKTQYGLRAGVYWTPQVVGGTGFIVSSLLQLIELQPDDSWMPPVDELGWHAALWNLVGGIGFTLSGAFGYAEVPPGCCQRWGVAFSTFWGSWAFLISSYVMLLEAVNQHPRPFRLRWPAPWPSPMQWVHKLQRPWRG